MNTNMKSSDVATVAIAVVIAVALLLGGWLLMWYNKDRYQFTQGKAYISTKDGSYKGSVYYILDRNTGEVGVLHRIRERETGEEVSPYWEK